MSCLKFVILFVSLFVSKISQTLWIDYVKFGKGFIIYTFV